MTRKHAITRHFLSVLLCALLVAAFAPLVAAGDGPRIFQPEEVEALAKKLGLSAKQKSAIRKIHDNARKAEVKLHAEVEVNSIDLRRELEQNDPKEKKVASYIMTIARLEGEVRKTRILASLAVRKVLSAEQRKKMAKYRGRRHRQVYVIRDEAMEAARAEMEAEAERMDAELAELEAHAKEIDERALSEVKARKHEIERTVREMRRKAREFERQHREAERELERERDRARDRAREKHEQKGMAEIRVNAKPPAKIYLDGRRVGTTPVVIKTKAGQHMVKAEWKDHVLQRRVTVKAGKNIQLILEPPRD